MNKLTALLLCSIFLVACQRRDEYGTQFGINKKTIPQMMEGSNYYEFPEISPGKQYKSESTFCYKMQTDVLCYDKPRKGWEDRMVGYQEPLRRVQNQQYNNAYQTPEQQSNEWTWPSFSMGLSSKASDEPHPHFNPKYNAGAGSGRFDTFRAVASEKGADIRDGNLVPLQSVTVR